MLRDASFGSNTSVATSGQNNIGSKVVVNLSPWVIGVGVVGALVAKDENLKMKFGAAAAIGTVAYLVNAPTGTY